MPVIQLETRIKARQQVVFDLSRSIDFHLQSSQQHKETVVAGKAEGLIGLGETVTWRAKHFGLFLKHTAVITALTRVPQAPQSS